MTKTSGRSHPTTRMAAGGRLWRAWTSAGAATVALWLAAAGCLTLFMSSAATVEVVYTIRPSYVLLGAACAVGAPIAFQGWRAMPPSVRWSAVGLVAAYATAIVAGDQTVLHTQARAGEARDLVYLTDVTLGVACVGLVIGLVRAVDGLRPLVLATLAGAVAASAYGLYQWPAQQFGWPFDDLVNTLDSTGFTEGGEQGNGLFGWERIRGTFLEPHFLAAYLAAALPLSVAASVWLTRSWQRLLVAAFTALLLAIVLTSSVPGWVALALGSIAGLLLAALARGHVRAAALLGGAGALLLVLAGLAIARPEFLGPITGRSDTHLKTTAEARTHQWEKSIELWTNRPLLGHGPGQSSVRLARTPTESDPLPDGRVLPSAQGLWAAALIDVGLLGLAAWLCFLLAALVAIGREAFVRPEPIRLSLFTSAVIATITALVAGDRLELRVAIMLGLGLALTAAASGQRGGPDDIRARQTT